MNRIPSLARRYATAAKSLPKAIPAKGADDVVVTSVHRTPMCKAWKGGFKDMSQPELLTEVLKTAVSRFGIDPALLDDIALGQALGTHVVHEGRAAALAAGIPDNVPLFQINRLCSSGLMAVTAIANQIRTGQTEIGLAVGVEHMTSYPDRSIKKVDDVIKQHPIAGDCLKPMGWTSENVAADFGITRERMDELSALSAQRAAAAQSSGRFDTEIMPITAFQKVFPESEERKEVVVSKDDGIRTGTTKEGLGKLRAAFPQWAPGVSTGGNSSQITDGGAYALLMKRSKAEELGLPIVARHIHTAVSGLAPRIMGIGPALAIPKVLEQTGLTKEDVDLWEVNEAFSTMYVYVLEKLGLDIEKVNVNGGAIALGHPLGCTGVRTLATGLHELARRDQHVFVSSMCIGAGMGAAAVFVRD